MADASGVPVRAATNRRESVDAVSSDGPVAMVTSPSGVGMLTGSVASETWAEYFPALSDAETLPSGCRVISALTGTVSVSRTLRAMPTSSGGSANSRRLRSPWRSESSVLRLSAVTVRRITSMVFTSIISLSTLVVEAPPMENVRIICAMGLAVCAGSDELSSMSIVAVDS